MSQNITKKFIKCHNYLIENSIVHNSSTLAKKLDIHRQFLSKVINEKGNVTLDIVDKMIQLFNVNPYFLFGNDRRMFLNPEANLSNIEYLTTQAYAGETIQFQETVEASNVLYFSLPGTKFEQGDYRAFSIAGDSMEPNFVKGDLVICSLLSTTYYDRQLKIGGVYVFVTKNSILLKRFDSWPLRHQLLLKSDNNAYQDIIFKKEDLQEIWKVEARLTEDLDLKFHNQEINNLKKIVEIMNKSEATKSLEN
jgi:phage repressor protein C with HTH and peptisase S24 domain